MSVIVRSAGGRGTASLIEEAFSDQQFRVNKTYVAVGDEITIDDQVGCMLQLIPCFPCCDTPSSAAKYTRRMVSCVDMAHM